MAKRWNLQKDKQDVMLFENKGHGMGNTCKPMAVSFQCMTKSTTKKKKKKMGKKKEIKDNFVL